MQDKIWKTVWDFCYLDEARDAIKIEENDEMKFSFPVPCNCGEIFSVSVSGTQFPEDARCPKCNSTIWLVPPLGNLVGMAMLGRANAEVKDGDWTIAIVLSAMAVECDMAYLFMKWNRIEVMATREPNEVDEEAWETEWRKILGVAPRLDEVSDLLTGKAFDLFLSQDTKLLQSLHMRCPASTSAPSPKQFFIKELFHKRNKIVHSGEINFRKEDAEMCLRLATTLTQILAAMDAESIRALDAKHRSRNRS
jgi:hypothetical protein